MKLQDFKAAFERREITLELNLECIKTNLYADPEPADEEKTSVCDHYLDFLLHYCGKMDYCSKLVEEISNFVFDKSPLDTYFNNDKEDIVENTTEQLPLSPTIGSLSAILDESLSKISTKIHEIATHFDCLPTEGEEIDKENFTSKGYQITMNDLMAKLDYCVELSEEIKKFTDREN